MPRRTIIGVMGPGEGATPADLETAFKLGQLIAQEQWILLSGGRNVGIMREVNEGAKAQGGLTIGIMPTVDTADIATTVDIAIFTDMGSARNNINVLSSDVVIACGVGGAGTASEIGLALKAKKPVILLNVEPECRVFFGKLGGELVRVANDPLEAVELARRALIAINPLRPSNSTS